MNTLKLVLACVGAASAYVFVAGVVAHERRKVWGRRVRLMPPGPFGGILFLDYDVPWVVPAFWPVMLPLIVICVTVYTIAKTLLNLPYSAGYGLPELGRRFSDWRKKREIVKAVRESLRGQVIQGGPVCSCPASPLPHPVTLQDVAKAKWQGHVHDWLAGSFRVCRRCELKSTRPPDAPSSVICVPRSRPEDEPL